MFWFIGTGLESDKLRVYIWRRIRDVSTPREDDRTVTTSPNRGSCADRILDAVRDFRDVFSLDIYTSL